MEWFEENEDRSWDEIRGMADEAANYAGCKTTTARQWILQVTALGQPWRLLEQRRDAVITSWTLKRRLSSESRGRRKCT